MVNQAQVPLQMEGFAGSKRWNSYDCSTWNFDELYSGWRSEASGRGEWCLAIEMACAAVEWTLHSFQFIQQQLQFINSPIRIRLPLWTLLYLPHFVEVQWTLALFVAFRGVCWDLIFNICPFARCIVLLAGKVLRKYWEWELT